jgi:superfamily II DNA/RNA helicase
MTFENGFQEELDEITAVCANARMMFFSATISEAVLPYLKKYMSNVEFTEISGFPPRV